jgi:hypothetical protein
LAISLLGQPQAKVTLFLFATFPGDPEQLVEVCIGGAASAL